MASTIEATVRDGADETEQSGVGERCQIPVRDAIGAVDVLGGREQHVVGDAAGDCDGIACGRAQLG